MPAATNPMSGSLAREQCETEWRVAAGEAERAVVQSISKRANGSLRRWRCPKFAEAGVHHSHRRDRGKGREAKRQQRYGAERQNCRDAASRTGGKVGSATTTTSSGARAARPSGSQA